MIFKLKVLTLILLTGFTTLGQSKRDHLDNFFSTLSRNQQFNGNVLIAENGKIVYRRSFGYADFSNKKLNTRETTFPIASITKTFTATAILQLFEKGLLKISDPVIKYLPGFPYPTITIQHLLSHTSGLQPYDNIFDSARTLHPDTVFTNKDIINGYATMKLPLFYPPGEACNYDNVNYILLSLIVEKVSRTPYQDYVRENIFRPIGMNHTFFPEKIFYHYSAREKINLACTYWYPHLYSISLEKTDTIQFISKYWNTYNFQGFGEMVSTTEDLLKYDQALYKGKILRFSTLSQVYEPVLLNNKEKNKGNNNGNSFGLGWIVETDSTFGKIVRASGGAVGLRASLLRNLTKQQTIILIDNTQKETDDIAKDVLKIINGKTVKPYGKSAAKIFGNTLVTKGLDAALAALEKIRTDDSNYFISENEFNNLGYDFMSNNKKDEAVETFRINTQLFPGSWNVYDSYGEALMKYGRKKEAIEMYKKSVALNPDNQNGKKILEGL